MNLNYNFVCFPTAIRPAIAMWPKIHTIGDRGQVLLVKYDTSQQQPGQRPPSIKNSQTLWPGRNRGELSGTSNLN